MIKSLRHDLRGSSAAVPFSRDSALDGGAALHFAAQAPQAARAPGPQGITGTSGDDTLIGDDSLDDFIEGLGGNDTLDGRGGADTTDGGLGDDIHHVDRQGDVIVERENEGYDTVITGTNYLLHFGLEIFTLAAGVHVEEIIGQATDFLSENGIELRGNEFGQIIRGSAENNSLHGAGGLDTLHGNGGDDILYAGTLDSGGFNHIDTVQGDVLIGGTGDDYYYVGLGDVVQEAAGEGTDVIQITGTFNYTLAAGLSVEILTAGNGIGAVTLAGNELNNIINGRGGADVLDGAAGADRLFGGSGNDTYILDNAGDQVTEYNNEGSDTVRTTVSYVLGDHVENLRAFDTASTTALTLTGNALANIIEGNNGDNIIDGGGNGDTMTGHGGNDSYYVNTALDTVVETAGEGNDRIYVSLSSYMLAAGLSIEILSTTANGGTATANFTGNELGQTIYGNAGNNILIGLGGDDQLYGWEGTNRLEGGTGDDWYFVGYGNDTVIELAGEGDADRVFTGADFGLEGTHVEILSTDWHEGTADLALGGNALNNIIIGNDGDNILYGKGGFDTIYGNGGDDIYQVSDAGDFIVEYQNDGNDRIFASVDYTLYDGGYVETISTDYNAGTAAITLGGNNLDNAIIGNAGVNTLYGKGGNDTLTGHGGADTFLFTSFGAGDIDAILDFAVGTDKIAFYSSVYTGLTPGSLPASAFVNGTTAADGDDRILYNSATGALFYDADGTGATAAVQFATVTAGTSLSAADFVVF